MIAGFHHQAKVDLALQPKLINSAGLPARLGLLIIATHITRHVIGTSYALEIEPRPQNFDSTSL